MSEIQRLQKFVSEKPGLALTPLFFIQGSYISPKEALERLNRNLNVAEIKTEVNKRGLTTPEQERSLTIAHYQSLLQHKEQPRVLWFQAPFPVPQSVEKLIEEIRNNTPIGKSLVQAHVRFLRDLKAQI